MAEPLIEIENLKKYFPISGKKVVKAVDGVSFQIYKGESLGIVGESGCGKSTLGRCLIRLQAATDGTVLFHGKDISRLKGAALRDSRKHMQIIFQDPYGSLNPRFRVREIIAEPLTAHKTVSKKDIRDIVAQLLKDVGLNESHMERYPHEFSGGQRQRISIARSLALNPAFIVCDEAVSALDVSTQAQILNLLKELQVKYQLTYLFISHNLSVVNFISDRVGVMYLGQLVELADVNRLYQEYRHPYTEALLSAIPNPDPEKHQQRKILPGDVPSPSAPPSGCRFHPRCDRCQEICRHRQPDFRDLGDGHWVACHFPIGMEGSMSPMLNTAHSVNGANPQTALWG